MVVPRETLEVIIVGGGIAGNALAAVLARAGKSVLVLERSTVYRDRVRGEYFQPWGVAEALRLGLHETLLRAGGTHLTRAVPYDETEEPAAALAAAVALDRVLPGVPGALGAGIRPCARRWGQRRAPRAGSSSAASTPPSWRPDARPP